MTARRREVERPHGEGGEPLHGTLRRLDGATFVEARDGTRHLADELIWHGYVEHFAGRPVFARALPQRDYERGRPIQILWPDEPVPTEEFVEIYYNERLVKYPASLLGHNAINVNGHIYNFSHLLNENEVLTHEEYFYRPALGEFAPSPRNGRFEVLADGRRYLDKFGRRFMRTIHVARVFGIDTARMAGIFDGIMDRVRDSATDGGEEEKWPEFHPLNRNCTTLIRDGLNAYGFAAVAGRFPRDLFVNAAYHLGRKAGIRLEILAYGQLEVDEAPRSQPTWMLNPRNYWRRRRLPAGA